VVVGGDGAAGVGGSAGQAYLGRSAGADVHDRDLGEGEVRGLSPRPCRQLSFSAVCYHPSRHEGRYSTGGWSGDPPVRAPEPGPGRTRSSRRNPRRCARSASGPPSRSRAASRRVSDSSS
jgi:hypothetical protein